MNKQRIMIENRIQRIGQVSSNKQTDEGINDIIE